MKTKELIAALQEEDPTGEGEVCVWGQDIYFVESQPCYYDGYPQRLVHDEKYKGKCYSVVGGKFISQGYKVVIHPMSIRNALLDADDPMAFPIDLSELPENIRARYQESIDHWRKEMVEIHEKTHKWCLDQIREKLSAYLTPERANEWIEQPTDHFKDADSVLEWIQRGGNLPPVYDYIKFCFEGDPTEK